MNASAISFPDYKHLPGINARPDDGFLDAWCAMAPAITDAENADKNRTWCYGLQLIDAGFFWEAHEVLEPVWLNCRPNSRERFLVQGLIQYANAALKFSMGRPAAARRLITMAQDHLKDASSGGADVLMDVSITDYRKRLDRLKLDANQNNAL